MKKIFYFGKTDKDKGTYTHYFTASNKQEFNAAAEELNNEDNDDVITIEIYDNSEHKNELAWIMLSFYDSCWCFNPHIKSIDERTKTQLKEILSDFKYTKMFEK